MKARVNSNRIFIPGNRYLIIFLTFLSAFPPLTIDMYLPALPTLAETMHTTNEIASYSLTYFFFIYAFATLVWGPVSDKYGRKPVLIYGILLYILSSIAISICTTIWQLLLLRCLQAIGCASASAMSLAIVKDVLRGPIMERLVSLMQAAHILAPLTAPVIGGAMLYFTSWRGIFWVLTICGILALAGSLLYNETGLKKKDISLFGAFARIRIALENKKFLARLLLFSILAMPFSSFLAASSFVYQVQFKLTPQEFSGFFAFNALFSLLGPLAHLYIFSKWQKTTLIFWEILIPCIAGVLMLLLGNSSPWIFALLMMPITFCGAAMRPPATVLMMQAIHGDNGVAASLIQCCGMFFGSLSMLLATLTFWPTPASAIATIAFVISLLCLLFWIKLPDEE